MNKQVLPAGVWPVMLTPFLPDGCIDWEAYDGLIDLYIDSGASGLFATCLSGEISELTLDECIRLASRAKEYAAGRVPVVAGAIRLGAVSDMVEHAVAIGETGADAVVISPSQFAAMYETEEQLKGRLFRFLDEMDPSVALGIYECPYPYHRLISASLLGELAQTGRFVFMKDTCSDISVLREKIKAVEGTPMRLYNAHAMTLADSIQAGAVGFSGIGANFFFDPYRIACNQTGVTSGQLEKADELISAVQHAVCMSGAYPAFAKYYLNRQGVSIAVTCRTEQTPKGNWEELADALEMKHEQFLRGLEPVVSPVGCEVA